MDLINGDISGFANKTLPTKRPIIIEITESLPLKLEV